jgi:glycine C-acetyltransferase
MSHEESRYRSELQALRDEGLFKQERVITTPQGVHIATRESGEVLNFCANNYLGLANHPQVVEAAAEALRSHGFGMASVRFICGTQDLHKLLEHSIAEFLGTDDAILYTSCFDANTGLFETLLDENDAVISDALNHASIIDGIRLCKAQRLRYAHGDMEDLERQLQAAQHRRTRLIATDGVFSMDGDIAKLDAMVPLAEQYGAMLMVDDSHATGVLGTGGRGSAEYHGVMDRIDIYTSTLGKALGGGSGGFTAARGDIVGLLRQRSRPYLFSNTLAPPLAAAALRVLQLMSEAPELRERLHDNTRYFRLRMIEAGFEIRSGEHPIVPIMLYDATLAQRMAASLLQDGIYVIGFSYPVVPKGRARIRVQISAAHERGDLDRAVEAFVRSGRELGVLAGA